MVYELYAILKQWLRPLYLVESTYVSLLHHFAPVEAMIGSVALMAMRGFQQVRARGACSLRPQCG